MAVERTLIIDGDVLAFRVASRCQKIEEDRFGVLRPFAYKVEGEAGIDNFILTMTDRLQGTHVLVVLSDPEANWRMELLPTYKSNRSYTIADRPLLLGHLKNYLRATYGAFHWPGLEADDTIGILATEPPAYSGERLVVGNDKDFMQIPGMHYQLKEKDWQIITISEHDADMFHYRQTLSGDRIDGYSGCPGIGPERARQIIEHPVILKPEQGVVTRGKRKGESVTKWVSEPTADIWACIVTHYQKAGLSEKDALLSARVARILRHGEYNREKGEVRLWAPQSR